MNIPLQKRDILILNSLHKLGPLSNQELAQLFDLSPSSISNILKQLITKGILTEIDSKFYRKKNRERERSKKTYHLNPNDGYAIAVDGSDCAYVTGLTGSTDFPTEDPYDASYDGYDVFVTKLSASGNSLIYGTYLGGSGKDDEILEAAKALRFLCEYSI